MIDYCYLTEFELIDTQKYTNWLSSIASKEGKTLGRITFIFTNDDYLLDLNKKYLDHDYFTDILTFDYTNDSVLGGDIFISEERVRENAVVFRVAFERELIRVMAHGLLHMMGYDDKSDANQMEMRQKEEAAIRMFHVEQ